MFQNLQSGGNVNPNPNSDYQLDQPPEDSISKLAFAPNSNYLIASSWDNNVSAGVSNM